MTRTERLEKACEVLSKLKGDKFNLEVAGSKFSVHRGGCGYLSRTSKKGAWKPTAIRLTWEEVADRLYNELILEAEFIAGMPEERLALDTANLLCD